MAEQLKVEESLKALLQNIKPATTQELEQARREWDEKNTNPSTNSSPIPTYTARGETGPPRQFIGFGSHRAEQSA